MDPSGALTFRFLCNKKNILDIIILRTPFWKGKNRKNIPRYTYVSVCLWKTNYRSIQLKINIYKDFVSNNCVGLR